MARAIWKEFRRYIRSSCLYNAFFFFLLSHKALLGISCSAHMHHFLTFVHYITWSTCSILCMWKHFYSSDPWVFTHPVLLGQSTAWVGYGSCCPGGSAGHLLLGRMQTNQNNSPFPQIHHIHIHSNTLCMHALMDKELLNNQLSNLIYT